MDLIRNNLNKIKFNKLRNSFRFMKLPSGSSFISIRFNEFFEKNDPFGIKLNTFNMKKLREGRSSLTFLPMLRRSAKDSYVKFTKNTEVQFNILLNEYFSKQLDFFLKQPNITRAQLKFLRNETFANITFDGFQGLIYKRFSNFHLHSSKLYKIRGWTRSSLTLNGFNDSYLVNFQIRSQPFYNRLIVFGKKV